jgi:XTP/dITP diphosphohydrolase
LKGPAKGASASNREGRGGWLDLLFFPNGFDQTFAKLGEVVKNRLSHRANALAKPSGGSIQPGWDGKAGKPSG